MYGLYENSHSLSFTFSSPFSIYDFLSVQKIMLDQEFCMQLGPKFMKDNGLNHVTFSTADGALEAAPAVSNILFVFVIVYDDATS